MLACSMSSTIAAGLAGSRVSVTPSGASASLMALITAGVDPMAPPSPQPLYPPTPGPGISTWPNSIGGTSVAVGSR